MDEQNNTNMGAGETKSSMVWIIVVVLIVLGVGAYMMFGKKLAPMGGAKTDVASVATVNGVAIPQAEYDTQLASALSAYKAQGIDVTASTTVAQVQTQVLDGLISNELVAQGIKAAGITAAPADVDKQVDAAKTQSGDADKFQAELVKNNLTEAKLRENISKQLVIQAYLLKNIDMASVTVTDAEIAQFYADYSKSQKASGQKTVPALKDLSAQIKQQITSNKQQKLVSDFVASLRAKANVVMTAK